MTFEARHRELREATETETELLRRERMGVLREFESRTGPLVDDAIAAAREMLLLGAHDGPCEFGEHGRCSLHVRATQRREKALNQALWTLNEEAKMSAGVKTGPEPSAVTFEGRHRELRHAEEAARPPSLGLSAPHVAAFKALSEFRDATGPLVEALVVAVRAEREIARRLGDHRPSDDPVIAAVDAALDALDALDEESARG